MNHLATFTADTSLFTDAGTAIAAIAVAFVAALAIGLSMPVGRKVYKSVKSVIAGA